MFDNILHGPLSCYFEPFCVLLHVVVDRINLCQFLLDVIVVNMVKKNGVITSELSQQVFWPDFDRRSVLQWIVQQQMQNLNSYYCVHLS